MPEGLQIHEGSLVRLSHTRSARESGVGDYANSRLRYGGVAEFSQ